MISEKLFRMRDPGRGAEKRRSHSNLPDNRRSAEIRLFPSEIDFEFFEIRSVVCLRKQALIARLPKACHPSRHQRA